MLSATRSEMQLLARRVAPGASIFVAMEGRGGGPADGPANGGMRLLPYLSDGEAVADAYALCQHMRIKHRLYGTGFRGAKVVVRGSTEAGAKAVLLGKVAEVLQELKGQLYTGCDLNTTRDDMRALATQAPYVLAALDSGVDASRATGEGVIASLLGALEVLEGTELDAPQRFLVHGCGATGGVVARRLRDAGAQVFTVDAKPGRAAIPGCIDVSEHPDWASLPVDVLMPCSMSRLVDAEVAKKTSAKLVIGAANDSMTEEAQTILDQREIRWVPDPVSNAGAVVVDSVEHFSPDAWRGADPESIYAFVAEQIRALTRKLLLRSMKSRAPLKEVVEAAAQEARHLQPLGRAFGVEAAA